MKIKWMFFLVACLPSVLYAGRPLETDDAAVTGLNTCQLDFWTETSLNTRQDNFNGGCNLFGHSEFSTALGAVQGDQEDLRLRALGYKHVFQDFSDSRPGFGLAVNREWGRPANTDQSSKETLITTIATLPLVDDELLLHANLGFLHYSDHSLEDRSLFKAAALDYSLNEKMGLSVEAFSGVQESLSWRVGARYTLIRDFLQIDASYGSDFGQFADSRVFTIGFGITPEF